MSKLSNLDAAASTIALASERLGALRRAKNPGSSPTPSMPMVLSLACTQMKMTPSEAITASTVNAAYSVSRGDKIGSLEHGKLANFVIFDCEDYRELAYWFGMPQTLAVYIRGDCVLNKSL